MQVVPLISSLLVFASVVLLVRYGKETIWRRFANQSHKNAEKYRTWGNELFVGWSENQAIRAGYAANAAIIVVALMVLLVTRSIVFAATAAFVTYYIPLLIYKTTRRRRLERFEEQLPEAINVLVASVRAEGSLEQGIKEVSIKMRGPVAEEFGRIYEDYRQGGTSIENALEWARARLDVENFTMISSALIINKQYGGQILHILERLGYSIREISRLKKKIVTETAEVRSQEKVILFMTPLFGFLICMFDSAIPNILFNTVLGNLLLVIVVGLQVLAVFWIRRIVHATI